MNRSRAYVSILLALALLLPCAAPAVAVTSSDLTQHQKAAQDARARAAQQKALADQLAKETARLDKLVDDLQADADALDPEIATAEQRTARLKADVIELKGQIAAKQSDIDKTQAEYELEQGYFAGRVEASYKQGDWFYLDLLLSAKDVTDFIARTNFVTRAMKSSADVAIRLTGAKDRLTKARIELSRALETVSAKKKEAQTAENKLKELQDARQAKTNEQNAVLGQKSQLLETSKANVKKLLAFAAAEEAESSRIAAMLRGGGSGQYNGVMAWPVPGFYRITSPFGWRYHPVLKVRKFHSGIDVGKRPDGTPILGAAIVAAGSGKVIFAGPRGGYGNVVMIDHGNGVVSVYAHQRSGGIKVGVGQQVSKGQRIGTVGSSGLSTGPHLHFEVRVNGTPKNPMTYLD